MPCCRCVVYGAGPRGWERREGRTRPIEFNEVVVVQLLHVAEQLGKGEHGVLGVACRRGPAVVLGRGVCVVWEDDAAARAVGSGRAHGGVVARVAAHAAAQQVLHAVGVGEVLPEARVVVSWRRRERGAAGGGAAARLLVGRGEEVGPAALGAAEAVAVVVLQHGAGQHAAAAAVVARLCVAVSWSFHYVGVLGGVVLRWI